MQFVPFKTGIFLSRYSRTAVAMFSSVAHIRFIALRTTIALTNDSHVLFRMALDVSQGDGTVSVIHPPSFVGVRCRGRGRVLDRLVKA
jgi:hypothetical protein